MQVTETAGEISASVEETNRVRAELGMAPLAAGRGSQRDAEMAAPGQQITSRQRQKWGASLRAGERACHGARRRRARR